MRGSCGRRIGQLCVTGWSIERDDSPHGGARGIREPSDRSEGVSDPIFRPVQVGDVVRWHPEAEMNVEWIVTAVHPNGRLTIEADIAEDGGIRRVLKGAYQRDCKVVGQQIALELL